MLRLRRKKRMWFPPNSVCSADAVMLHRSRSEEGLYLYSTGGNRREGWIDMCSAFTVPIWAWKAFVYCVDKIPVSWRKWFVLSCWVGCWRRGTWPSFPWLTGCPRCPRPLYWEGKWVGYILAHLFLAFLPNQGESNWCILISCFPPFRAAACAL